MSAQAKLPLLTFDADFLKSGACVVRLCSASDAILSSIGTFLQGGGRPEKLFRVTVAEVGGCADDELPSVSGRYVVSEGEMRFTPHLPFQPGLVYRATFTHRLLHLQGPEDLAVEFSLPRTQGSAPANVTRIYPSDRYLPENILRFYVCFSNPMQRGRAKTEVSVLGPDGITVPDVLYRAPVELWDRGVLCLTVLLDPGRLKRGVGPNRQLGPPLKAGQVYTLVVGAGMANLYGNQLRDPVYKAFQVVDAVRESIATEQWVVHSPAANSREPLTLVFPRPLDWALLSRALAVTSRHQGNIYGKVAVDQDEKRWQFTPDANWIAGLHDVLVSPNLEDVCGNTVVSPFDRVLRATPKIADYNGFRTVSFQVV